MKFDFLDHPEIRDFQEPAVYVLVNTAGQIFYVGRTNDPLARFLAHRSRFGRGILMKLIQTDFSSETQAKAELKWIRRLQDHGCPLENEHYLMADNDRHV